MELGKQTGIRLSEGGLSRKVILGREWLACRADAKRCQEALVGPASNPREGAMACVGWRGSGGSAQKRTASAE